MTFAPTTTSFNFDTLFSSDNLAGLSDILGSFGEFASARDESKQYKKQAAQVLQSAKQEIELTALQQGRAMGERRAAYGKSGVALSGSAKTLLEEQAKLDDIALLNKKYNAQIDIGNILAKRRAANTQASTALSKGVMQGIDLLSQNKGFGLGSL